jgi:hypothetical protein
MKIQVVVFWVVMQAAARSSEKLVSYHTNERHRNAEDHDLLIIKFVASDICWQHVVPYDVMNFDFRLVLKEVCQLWGEV